MFGPDPKDELVAYLKDEVAHLRSLLSERDKQILAMSNAAAYRLLDRDNFPADPKPAVPLQTALDRRWETFKPEYSVGDIKAKFTPESMPEPKES
jgi:hypothetical protein